VRGAVALMETAALPVACLKTIWAVRSPAT
jgi:hypothetical protein